MPIPNLAHAWASSPERLAVAIAVTIAFAALARALRGVNLSGALAGGLACFFLFAGLGPAAFGVLVTLFVLTWVSTRLGYRRKQALGLAERREGRNAWQVLANLAVAAAAAFVDFVNDAPSPYHAVAALEVRLLAAGFQFEYPTIAAALAAELGSGQPLVRATDRGLPAA